jgi:hypothetical protein
LEAALTPALGSDIVLSVKQTVTTADLEWLERQGYWVDPNPFVLPDGRKYYDVDGLSCSEEQIIRHLTEGTKLDEG